jgi:hypothetical protein
MSGEPAYEELGVFYLGREHDPITGTTASAPILYDAKDLTTHAVIVGMTGSGKTGLAISILEEAAIDGIPIIAIDPKGDLGNLLLTFPELRAEDLRPWVDEGEAAREGRTPEQHAAATAALWKKGLAEWGQSPDRIARFADSAERCIYTPGSRAGRPLSLLRSLDAPQGRALDEEALQERIRSAVSGLLGLLGIDADPLRSREHILLSSLLDRSWRKGRSLDLAALIQQIQRPPIERVGVLDLESFFPARERSDLAMALNNLLASPAFSVWLEGDPLDAGRLLFTDEGKPRMSIISIAHLGDAERMFVVTQVLNQLIAWMRAQPGSRSLRALLYMDEVFGYFPPTANPPAKTPMLTLLKQARAYGVGVVLATQNPVDLDYKGLSNTGTWFLGRLQTERDKARVLDGLEGASTTSGSVFDRAAVEATLSGLESRVFMMNNVHEDAPVTFHTRWVLSYLAGPLTRDQIRRLAPPQVEVAVEPAAAELPEAASSASERPLLPSGVREHFVPVLRAPGEGARLVYRPALVGAATVHYAHARLSVDEWVELVLAAPLREAASAKPWEGAEPTTLPELDLEPASGASFAALPSAALRGKSFATWEKQLKSYLHREHPLVLQRCKAPKAVSRPGERPAEFLGRLRALERSERDLRVEKLRKRYEPKLARLRDRIARAEDRVEREQQQYEEKKLQSVISIGSTLLGALFGRKLASRGNVGRATTAARGMSRAARERGDIGRAEERMEALQEQLDALEAEFENDLDALELSAETSPPEVEEVRVALRKGDLEIAPVSLVWIPYRVDADGIAEPAGGI